MTASSALPAARIPDPMTAPPLRWGVIGPGWITERFVAAMHARTRQRVVAVGSQSAERAQAFAERHGIARSYGSYAQLAGDPGVDIVYVGTLQHHHHADALTVIAGGKHVLVEKPFAVSAAQAREVSAAAASAGVFCAEALWSFFLPKFDIVAQLLDAGALGQLQTVLADHGEWFPASHRIMRPELAGGPLFDLGVYVVALAVRMLGAPAEVRAAAQAGVSGVDNQVSIALSHAAGAQSLLHSTLGAVTACSATIAGSDATVVMPRGWFFPGEVILWDKAGTEIGSFTEARVGHDALFYEAAEIARCIADGRLETAVHPMADTIATLGAMDRVRELTGHTLPGPAASTG